MAFARPENVYMLANQMSHSQKPVEKSTSPTRKAKETFDSLNSQQEAKNSAIKYVAQILQRPDQLDKIEQHTKRIYRKKVTVEALLKSLIQSYLDGVNNGLVQLQSALKDIQNIKERIKIIKEMYKEVAPLVIKLKDIKDESRKHSQYATAVENLKHIFNVPEIIKKTIVYLTEGNLLHAHQCIQDLENSRDELLFEMSKIPSPSQIDINLINRYYEDVQDLNDKLSKQLWLVAERIIVTARKEPTLVVTMARIIEREERSDTFIESRRKACGFMPPGRPKKLKENFFEILSHSIENSLEGTQNEDRDQSNVWLVKHLEIIRIKYLDDLRVIKKLLPPCFPPHYNIFDVMTQLYHKALSRRLHELVESNLEGNEIITLLTWIKEYDGRDLLGHPDLQISSAPFGPLLDQTVIDVLVEKYLQTMQNNVQEWMQNTVNADSKDWYVEKEPDILNGVYYHTQMPFILHDMCKQNIKVAQQVSQALTTKVVHLLVNQMGEFANLYSNALQQYYKKHIIDRKLPHFYIHYTIAVINNCQSFGDFMIKLRDEVIDPEEQDEMDKSILQMKLNNLTKNLDQVADRGCAYLLDEVFMDLEIHMQGLMTKEWATDKNVEGIIRATMDDYDQDFVHLRPKYYGRLISEAETRIALEYVKGILQKRFVFKTYEERKEASEKLVTEVNNLISFFTNLRARPSKQFKLDDNATLYPPKGKDQVSPLTCLVMISEIIKMRDTSLMTLELSGLINKYKDISYDNLSQILSIRGDMNRTDIKTLLAEVLTEDHLQLVPKKLGVSAIMSSASGTTMKPSPSYIDPDKSLFARINESTIGHGGNPFPSS